MAKIVFTAGRVSGFTCPTDKAQAFLWDVTAPGLGQRATPAWKPAYVFQGRYQENTIRLTIGNPDACSRISVQRATVECDTCKSSRSELIESGLPTRSGKKTRNRRRAIGVSGWLGGARQYRSRARSPAAARSAPAKSCQPGATHR